MECLKKLTVATNFNEKESYFITYNKMGKHKKWGDWRETHSNTVQKKCCTYK